MLRVTGSQHPALRNLLLALAERRPKESELPISNQHVIKK